MKRYLIIACWISIPTVNFSQSQEERMSVLEPIDRLFTGMTKSDSALVHNAFADEVSMATISKDKNGKPVVRYEAGIDGFLKAIGTPHGEVWSEPIWDLKMNIDGNFAQVWASYAFYRGNIFSHCGVDAFHLFKNPDGKWKIFHLADTRQKEGCKIPKKVSEKYIRP